jgi:hypothetical protein
MRFELPKGTALDRISSCGACMEQIANEAYARVYQAFENPIPVPESLEGLMEPIEGVRVVVHQRCIVASDEIIASYPEITDYEMGGRP